MKQQNVLRRTVNPPTYLMLFSAGLTLLLSSFFLRDGIALSPDGWAYWEGAVSLLKGHVYTYFGGEPLTDWGALFSLYLAGIQKLVGIHGQALRLLLALTLVVIVQLMRTGRVLVRQEQETEIPGSLVTPMMTLAPDYLAGSPLSVGSYTLVAPPSYAWIDRHYQTHTGGQVK